MPTHPFPPRATDPTCRAADALLPLLHAGELTQGQEATLRAHLASCGRCQRERAAYETLEAALRRHVGVRPDPLFASREELVALAQTRDPAPALGEATPLPDTAAPAPPAPPQRRRARQHWSWVSAVAALLVIVSITAGLVLSHHRTLGTTPTLLPTTPPSVYLTPTFYQSTNKEVVALDASTGRVRWRAAAGTAEVAPILQDGILYVSSSPADGATSRQSDLFAFRTSDGRLLWQHPLPGEIIKLAVSTSVVYVSTASTPFSTSAFRASDGALLWHLNQGPLRAVADGMVYINGSGTGGEDMPLYAVKASDGTILWQHAGNGPHAIDTRWEVYPAAGILYAIPDSTSFGGPLPGTLLALDPRTGQQLWSRSLVGPFIAAEPQVIIVLGPFVGAYSPQPPSEGYGLNPTDGSLRWRLQLPAPTYLNGAVFDNGLLYVGATDRATDNNTLAALDTSTGKSLWQMSLATSGAPTLAANGLLVVANSPFHILPASNWPPGRLEVRSAADGSLKWAYQTPNPDDLMDTRALVNGTLYVDTLAPYDMNPPLDPVTKQPEQHAVLSAFTASNGILKWHYDLGNLPYGQEFITIG